ncbi:tetratricopeptide repeat protein [Sorangium sp. So ce145]|uniref:tetratricopeptide repeat protein n=1 Tax=Sorangium sp. So ce145 TaxID=3133285 RepID=UPI003F5E363D
MRPDRAVLRWWRGREYRRLLDVAASELAGSRHADAEATCARALRIAEEIYGDGDAELTAPLYALSSARLAQGRLDEARASSARAIAIAEAAASTDPPLPRLLEQLAAILERQGELGDVEALFRRMLAGYERMRDPDPIELSALLNRLGLLLGRRGARAEAAPLFRRAIALREGALGARHALVAEALYNAATFLELEEDLPTAEREVMLRRALEIAEAGADVDRGLLASILHNLAAAREALGDQAEAAALYERALSAREALVGAAHPSLRPTLVRLAQVHHAAGRPSTALPLYERALALAEAELGADHPVATAIGAWMAEARSRS